MEVIVRELSVAITIGGGLDLALDRYNNLLVHSNKHGTNINLGPLTQQRAKELSEYLQRLAIHTPER